MANRFFEGAAHAALYAKFRPRLPNSLVNRMLSFLQEKYSGPLTAAIDVGCGSGQSTEVLAPHFSSVIGLDVSQAQISEAEKMNTKSNISFKVSGAETLAFPDNSLQMVLSCQACHWFDLPAFYKEVDRILVPGGVLALCGYSFPRPIYENLSEKLYEVIDHLYKDDLGNYVYQGSREVYLENYSSQKYKLPYQDCIEDREDVHYDDKVATVADLRGYITTWSGFQNFRAKNGDAEALKILDDFQERFMDILQVKTTPENTPIQLRFNYFLLMGRKPLD